MSRVRKKKSKQDDRYEKDYFIKLSKGDCKKRKFSTKKKALTNKDNQIKTDSNLTLFVYKCPECHNWHLTKAPRRK